MQEENKDDTILELLRKNNVLIKENALLKEFVNYVGAFPCSCCRRLTINNSAYSSYCYTCKKRQCIDCFEEQFICENEECKNETRNYCRSTSPTLCCKCFQMQSGKSVSKPEVLQPIV